MKPFIFPHYFLPAVLPLKQISNTLKKQNLFVIMSDIVLTEEPFATPHSISEEIDVERVKHAGGRPKNVVWNYFEHKAQKHAGHYDAKCNFCNRYWKVGCVKKLQVHLARECEEISAVLKNKYMHIVAKRDGLLDDNMEIEATNVTNASEKDKNNELSTEQIAFMNRSILKAFVMCEIPFRVIENPYFINLFKNLQSNYNLPSRDRLSTNLLSEECVRVEIKINGVLEVSKNLTLGMKLFRIILYIYDMILFN